MTLSLLFSLLLGAPPGPAANPPAAELQKQSAPRADYEDPVASALAPHAGGLSADEVAARAVENSPEMAASDAQLRAAAAGLDQTMIQFLPQLKASASYTRLSQTDVAFGSGAIVGAMTPGLIVAAPCDPSLGVPPLAQCLYDQDQNLVGAADTSFENPLNQYSLQASLAVPLSDYALSLPSARKASKSQVRSAEHRRDAQRLRVEADARVAYYNWLKALAQVAVVDQSLAHTQARLVDARNLFEAGLVSRADVMRLEARVESTQSMAEQSREFRDMAARQVAMVMGESGAQTPAYVVGEDIFALASAPPEGSLEGHIEKAWSERSELKAFESSIQGVEHTIKATRANYFPRLDGFAEATYANPNQRFFPMSQQWRSSWSAGLSLSFVINQAVFTKAQVAQHKSTSADMRAQLAATQRAVAMEVSAAHAELRQAQAAANHQSQARAASEEAYRVSVELYRVGEATTTDIIEAEAERVNTSLQGANALIDLRVATSKLRYAIGVGMPAHE